MIRVLLVEDDPGVRGLITRVLRLLYDADVLEVADNQAAKEVLRTRALDLVITDLVHPGGSGLELLQEINSNVLLRRLPVLVQSGNASELGLEARRLGAAMVLPKPFSSQELATAIDRIRPEPRLRTVDVMQIELGCESQTLDYKVDLFLATRDERAALAKDVIAMANSGGGRIIAGVAEIRPGIFEPRGLSEERAVALEVSRLNRAVAPYIDPPLPISSRRVEHQGRTFVCLDIPDSGGELVMAARQNDAAGLLRGRIYIRTAAAESAEIRSSLEARNLIERLILLRGSGSV